MKLKTEGDETMTIGCIVNDRTEISRYAKLYLKEALKDEIIDIYDGYHINDFKPAFSDHVASEKAQMKTLQSVAEEADESIKQQTALLDKKAQFIDPDTNKVIFTILNGRQYNA